MQNKTADLLFDNHLTIERHPELAETILSLSEFGDDLYYLQQLLFSWLQLEDILEGT